VDPRFQYSPPAILPLCGRRMPISYSDYHQTLFNLISMCLMSGIRRGVNEVFALQGCYAAWIGC
jgi:hypothetical protein